MNLLETRFWCYRDSSQESWESVPLSTCRRQKTSNQSNPIRSNQIKSTHIDSTQLKSNHHESNQIKTKQRKSNHHPLKGFVRTAGVLVPRHLLLHRPSCWVPGFAMEKCTKPVHRAFFIRNSLLRFWCRDGLKPLSTMQVPPISHRYTFRD